MSLIRDVLAKGEVIRFDETLLDICPQIEEDLLTGLRLILEGRTIYINIPFRDAYQELDVEIEVNDKNGG